MEAARAPPEPGDKGDPRRVVEAAGVYSENGFTSGRRERRRPESNSGRGGRGWVELTSHELGVRGRHGRRKKEIRKGDGSETIGSTSKGYKW